MTNTLDLTVELAEKLKRLSFEKMKKKQGHNIGEKYEYSGFQMKIHYIWWIHFLKMSKYSNLNSNSYFFFLNYLTLCIKNIGSMR